jgi:hypothetical protein
MASETIRETYSVNVFCTNCGYSGSKSVDQGRVRPMESECPNCKCWTLRTAPCLSRCGERP